MKSNIIIAVVTGLLVGLTVYGINMFVNRQTDLICPGCGQECFLIETEDDIYWQCYECHVKFIYE